MRQRMQRLAYAVSFAASGAFSMGAFAADHANLEEGLPLSIEDAYPIAYGGRELQTAVRYDRTAEDDDSTILEPRFEWGAFRNGQLKASVPVALGSDDDRNSGDLRLEALYNFNQEGVAMPAFALGLRADVPTGEDSEGVDTGVKFIASKLLGRMSRFHALHLNVTWFDNAEALPDERDDYYTVAIGYSARVSPDTTLLVDLVREEDKRQDETAKLIEVGMRRQMTPLLVFTAALHAPLDSDSPDVRVVTGVQYDFGASQRLSRER